MPPTAAPPAAAPETMLREPADGVPPPPDHSAQFPLALDSPGHARRFLRDALSDHPFLDDAAVLLSELATNATLHARSPFEVLVWAGPDRVTVVVRDHGGLTQPCVRRAVPANVGGETEIDMAVNGRGMGMVDAMASAWGFVRDPDKATRVWFTLGAPE